MTAWLADGLEEALRGPCGSPEREQILLLLGRARKIRLDEGLARAAALATAGSCAGIERDLDRLELPAPAAWLEYPHAARCAGGAAPGAGAPETVGCLLASDPHDPGHVAVFAAWRLGDGRIFHSYALMHWHKGELFSLALRSPARDDGGARDRLMAAARASIPPGLLAEMEIWQGLRPAGAPLAANDPAPLDRSPRGRADAQTLRDVTGEHLFLLSALLLLGSRSVVLSGDPGGEGRWLAALRPPGRLAGALARIPGLARLPGARPPVSGRGSGGAL